MKDTIVRELQDFVAEYQRVQDVTTAWGEPLVGFAAADDLLFVDLKRVVVDSHALPADLLPEARTVISFFLPFPKSLATGNLKNVLSSPEWARSYIETNELIARLNEHMISFLASKGASTAAIPATHNWIEDKLVANWSHRHVAFVAGLGRFGLNNMLITRKGCSGRIGSLITSMEIAPDLRPENEACLHKDDGSCGNCVRQCVNDALETEGFDRFKCYAQLLKNVEEHANIGYADVCGKCLAAVPCSHANPVELKNKARAAKNCCIS